MAETSESLADESLTELARLVARSRLIGADPALVLHGGGNTSSKIVERDHLGRERHVLRIKGSGSDLATVEKRHFSGLWLDELLPLREREAMNDDEMLAYLLRCLVEPDGPRPSIETLLHAFLPAEHVGQFLLTARVWRVMAEQGIGGSLVYVSSKNAFAPGAGFGAYSVAKAGLVQLMRIAALEGGSAGIRANAVNPDAIFGGSKLWSDEVRGQRAEAHGVALDELEEFYASRSLLGRPVTAADVAEAVAFLVSERSRATTGCVLAVDGGVPGAFPR